MKLDKYELKSGRSLTVFEFISEGRKGQISKLIQFRETNVEDIFNLGFGDKDPISGEIDDKVVSNNGDSEKVLVTVVASVLVFTKKYPDRWVYASGHTKSRTRLYRMGITKHLSQIERDFELYGLKQGEWEYFERGIEYTAFLAKRKKK